MSSIVQIKDSAYDGLQSLRVYGNTVQNLWVNPSGKQNGVTVTSNADGSMTISGTSTGTFYIYSTIYSLKPGSTYTLSIDKAIRASISIQAYNSDGYISDICSVGSSGVLTNTAVLPQNATYARLMIQGTAGRTLSGTYRVMLNEGATAQPWCPPGLNSVGDGGSVDIVTAGKNLLDIPDTQKITGYGGPYTFTLGDDGSVTCSPTPDQRAWDYKAANVKMLLPAGTYTLSLSISEYVSGCGIRAYRSDETLITQLMVVNDGTYVSGYFTLDTPTEVGIIYKMSTAKAYPQLELGSSATAYEPPSITTTPIDLQGHTLNALPDGTRDELHIDGGGNVVLEKRCGVATAPKDAGSWNYSTDTMRASFKLLSAGPSAKIDETKRMLCDKLPIRKKVDDASYAIVAYIEAMAKNPAITSTATAATVAGGATYIYQLAEPQTIDLGTIELPKLRKKPLVNTIWANGTAEGTGFSLAPEIDCEYNRWSTYCDGFKTHGKHSYFDMGCCLAARDTGTPEKKNITATVPYMSGFYDFSKLYGAIAFEARQLTYRFEFVEDSREELQQKKSQFLEWLSQVHDEEIADDDIPGRHFIGSLSEWEFEEGEEGQSGSLEVTFNCQPFLEADEDTTKTCSAGSNTVTVEGQPVNAYAKTSSGTATIQIGGVTQSVGTTEIRLSVQLQPGDNAVTVTGSAVTLRWRELTA